MQKRLPGRRPVKKQLSRKTTGTHQLIAEQQSQIEGPPLNILQRRLRSLSRSVKCWLLSARKLVWRNIGLFKVLWGLLLGLPPFFITNLFNNTPFYSAIAKQMPFLANPLMESPVQWTVAAFAWIPIAEGTRKKVAEWVKEAPMSWKDAPQTLLAALDLIAENKEKHIASIYSELRARHLNGCIHKSASVVQVAMFSTADLLRLNCPEAQFWHITLAIYTTFEELTRTPEDKKLQTQVSLAVVEGHRIQDFLCFAPTRRQVSADVKERLSVSNSTIMTAVRNERRGHAVTVVSSTHDELDKRNGCYVRAGDNTDKTDGSQLCYAFEIPETEVALVVSIFYPRRDAYQKRYESEYEEILRRFGTRLRLEYYVYLLKGLANEVQEV